MEHYLYLEVSEAGNTFPFAITANGAVMAQSSSCKSKQEVAITMRNFLRGLWRRGHISGKEFLVIRDAEVNQAWHQMMADGGAERPGS